MANPYFNHVNNRVAQGSRALDSQINNIADEVALGFDRLPTEAELKENTLGYAVATGTGSALIAVLTYTPTLLDGFNFSIKFPATNPGAATLNVNSTGVKNVVNSDGTELTPGAIVSGTIGELSYDITGDRYILTSNNSAWGKPTDGFGQSPSEYCPGYAYTFVSTTVWRVLGRDVTGIFNPGRRLKFVDGENTYFGTITSSVHTGSTDMTMVMEGGDVLTNTITIVCLTTGTAGWSVISADPFIGDAIIDITVGDIGITTYLFAVGNAGKCGVSADGGLTWVMLSTGTTEDLKACTYDTNAETFWAGGDAGVLIKTTNATSIVLDTTSVPALSGTSNFNITGFAYSDSDDALMIFYKTTPTLHSTAYSITQGTTWIKTSDFGLPAGNHCTKCNVNAAGTVNLYVNTVLSSTSAWFLNGFLDPSYTQTIINLTINVTAPFFFWDGGVSVWIFGSTTGQIAGRNGWFGIDDVSLSQGINHFAWSPIHERLISVGNNQQIAYIDKIDAAANDAWTNVSNGFNPLANITAAVWDATHGNFCAVADNGQIARSTNGLT